MKTILLLLSIILLNISLNAQKRYKYFDQQSGDLEQIPANCFMQKMISYDQQNGSTYILWREENSKSITDFYIEQYSSYCTKSAELQLNLYFDKQKMEFVDVIDFADRLHLIAQRRDVGKSMFSVVIKSINKILLQEENDLRSLFDIKLSGGNVLGSFSYAISQDSTKLLVMYNVVGSDTEVAIMHCFDQDMNKLWSENFSIAYDNELAYENNSLENSMIHKIAVDNKGRAYFVYSKFSNRKLSSANMMLRNSYALVVYNHSRKKQYSIPIYIKDHYISDIAICPQESPSENTDVIVTGFFSKTNNNFMSGIFSAVIKEEAIDSFRPKTYDFTPLFLSNFMSKKRADKKKELFQYKINRTLPLSKGRTLIIAEQLLNYNLQKREFGQFNHLILSMIDEKGNVMWTKPILKSQGGNTKYEQYNSYAISIDEAYDKMYVFFNDHPNNMFVSKPLQIYSFSLNASSVFAICTIDFDGNINRQILFTNDRKKTMPCPTLSTYTQNGGLMIMQTGYQQNNLSKINVFADKDVLKGIINNNR